MIDLLQRNMFELGVKEGTVRKIIYDYRHLLIQLNYPTINKQQQENTKIDK